MHDYPRAALRARVQRTVLLTLRVGLNGEIQSVELARSSGSAQLDEVALDATRGLGEVQAPPSRSIDTCGPSPCPT